MKRFVIRGEEEMNAFGKKVADRLEPGDILALIGDLGTGKTTMTKAVAASLGVKEELTSPTFNIVKEYRSGRMPVRHFDVYRLESGEELFGTGGEEYLESDDGVCIIEWADKIAEILPDDTKVIFLSYGENEGERILECTF